MFPNFHWTHIQVNIIGGSVPLHTVHGPPWSLAPWWNGRVMANLQDFFQQKVKKKQLENDLATQFLHYFSYGTYNLFVKELLLCK